MAIKQGKAKEVLSKTFVEDHKDISEDKAAELIVKSEQKVRDLKEEQANDDKLNAAQQIVKDLRAGYSSAVKYEQAKIRFLLEVIDEIQGGSVNPHASV
jgi:hypothetical protein